MTNATLELAKVVNEYWDNPLGFVLDMFPWGEPGELERYEGPDANQREFLIALGEEIRKRGFDPGNPVPVLPVRMAMTSGHGTGKSAMGAWLALFILSTRPHSIGTVTAGTATQLEARTWTAIRYWTKLCATGYWFEVKSTIIHAAACVLGPSETAETWKLVAQTCREENAQSFAGQHAARSSSFYIFDEASTVPDGIWRVAYGGLTDGEPFMFAWGQPERNTGEFYEVCFGRSRDRWNHRTVDSRSSAFANKELIQEWISDYGADSDFCKVRIFGLPPSASELQYIDGQRVDKAKRNEFEPLADEPLIVGFDVSGGGSAWNVMWFRRGCDARSIKPIRISGEAGRDRNVLVAKAAQVLTEGHNGHMVSMMFIDSAFGAPICERLRAMGHKNVQEVIFGGASPGEHQGNHRAFMWAMMKEWLPMGCIPADDKNLAADLGNPGYHLSSSSKLMIESKDSMIKRGCASPDSADALALTFAYPVKAAKPKPVHSWNAQMARGTSWMSS